MGPKKIWMNDQQLTLHIKNHLKNSPQDHHLMKKSLPTKIIQRDRARQLSIEAQPMLKQSTTQDNLSHSAS